MMTKGSRCVFSVAALLAASANGAAVCTAQCAFESPIGVKDTPPPMGYCQEDSTAAPFADHICTWPKVSRERGAWRQAVRHTGLSDRFFHRQRPHLLALKGSSRARQSARKRIRQLDSATPAPAAPPWPASATARTRAPTATARRPRARPRPRRRPHPSRRP
jgi:hypothetical protein